MIYLAIVLNDLDIVKYLLWNSDNLSLIGRFILTLFQ